jgi:peptide deformylase
VREIVASDDIRLRHPVRLLREEEFGTEYVQNLAKDVLQTAAEGTSERPASVGLAAIQLGELISFVAIDLQADRLRTGKTVAPEYIGLANLVVTPLDEEIFTDTEGCHSVDLLAGLVPRFRRVHAKGYRLDGTVFEDEVEGHDGYLARVFQHEADHNEGRTFVNRVANDGDLFWVPGSDFKRFRANPQAWPPADSVTVLRYRSYTRS